METIEIYAIQCATDHSPIIYERWPVPNVIEDLVGKGGLEKKSLELENHGFDSYLAVHKGCYEGCNFVMRWIKNNFLFLMLDSDNPRLIEGFSKVLGKKPFVRYVCPIEEETIFEWDMTDPGKRYLQLAERFENNTNVGLCWISDSSAPKMPKED